MQKKEGKCVNIPMPIAVIAAAALVAGGLAIGGFFGNGKDSRSETEEYRKARPVNEVVKEEGKIPEPAVPRAQVSAGKKDRILGDYDAPITIVEFSDFQYPYCSRFHSTMARVAEEYPVQVRWVYKHFPLDSIHPYARKAAEASECAGDQEMFWEYANSLFARQSEISPALFSEIADNLELDGEEFDECLSSGKYADKVSEDSREGQALGVRGTPASFINGQLVSGAVPFENIKGIIDSLLQQ